MQARSQKIFLGSTFEEKVDLLILYMYHSLGAVKKNYNCKVYAYSPHPFELEFIFLKGVFCL